MRTLWQICKGKIARIWGFFFIKFWKLKRGPNQNSPSSKFNLSPILSLFSLGSLSFSPDLSFSFSLSLLLEPMLKDNPSRAVYALVRQEASSSNCSSLEFQASMSRIEGEPKLQIFGHLNFTPRFHRPTSSLAVQPTTE